MVLRCPCATSPSKRWGNTAKVKYPSVRKYAFPSIAVASFFLRIALRRIPREIQQRGVVGNDKVAAAVAGRTVENQQDVLASKLARQYGEEDLEACCIRGRHNQVDASAVLGEAAPYK